jgi:transcriptional regulator with XRE-family HTH domain
MPQRWLAEECTAFGREQEPPIVSWLTREVIAKIETGRRRVSVDELAILAGALGVSMTELLPDLEEAFNGTDARRADTEKDRARQEAARIRGETEFAALVMRAGALLEHLDGVLEDAAGTRAELFGAYERLRGMTPAPIPTAGALSVVPPN